MPKPRQTPLDPRLDAKVSELRKLLMTVKDLDEVCEFFHNELVPEDAFIGSGARSSNPRLLTALQAVLEVVAPEGKLGTPLILHLDQQAFYHGYSTWGPGHVMFFYFEQLDLGFCSYTPSLSSVNVALLRFSLTSAAGAATWAAWQSVSVATRKAPQ